MEKNYYTIDNLLKRKMIRMPVVLMISPRYNWLSSDAKIIYSMMLELTRTNNPLFDLPKNKNVLIDSNMNYYFRGHKEELMDLFKIQNEYRFKCAIKELKQAELIGDVHVKNSNIKLYPLLYSVEENEREVIDRLQFATQF
ncbi:replication initiator protein A [Staphylococcus sp. SS35]|nr:replication initiator protein A [Staphylococcus singaporensis]